MVGFIEDSARGAAIDLRREGVRKRVIGAVGMFGGFDQLLFGELEALCHPFAALGQGRATGSSSSSPAWPPMAAASRAAAAVCSASMRRMLANNSPRADIAVDALDAYGELRSHRAASGSKLRSMDASVACHR